MTSNTKKIKQDELRRLMNLEKKKLTQTVKKIDSPLARYDKDGTLSCIICQAVVRSEAVWTIHLNSKKHKENVANKVKKKEELVEPKPSLPIKRPAPPQPLPVSTKKVKGILKNAPAAPSYSTPINSISETSSESKNSSTINENTQSIPNKNSDTSGEEEEEDENPPTTLPEGFFDDPKLDAKVRNVEYKDPKEEEWEQFQKEIREETSKAQQIIAEDQEEATTERQIEEIDEQIRNWNRVVNLEKKKQAVITAPLAVQTIKEEESSGEDENFEEFLDWRSKKSFE